MTGDDFSPLRQLRYVRMPVADLGAAVRFAVDIVGLEPAGSDETMARFRCDSRYYALEFNASGATGRPVIGLEVGRADDLDVISDRLAATGIVSERLSMEACVERRIRAGVAFRDHSGNDFEIVLRPEDNPRRYLPSRDAGIVGLSHVAIGSSDVDRDLALWTSVLGARVSDRAGSVAYLAFDDRHHRIALHPSARAAFIDVTFEVANLDSIMQASYFLANRQVRIVRGPGREAAGETIFVTFEGPEGLFVSYGTEMATLTERWRPRQFATDPWSFCTWGAPTELVEYGRSAGS